MPAPEKTTIPPQKLPEVKVVVQLLKELEDLKALFPKVFAKLEDLARRLNPSIDAGDRVVRRLGVGSGPWELETFQTYRDHVLLEQLVGRARFLELGGVATTAEVLSLDNALFDAKVARGDVDAEVVAKVISYGPRYRSKPSKILIP